MTSDNHDHWCGLGWYHAGPCTCICGALGLMSKGEFIEQDSGVSQ